MSFSQRVVQQGSFVRNRFEYPLPCLPWVGCSYIFPRILWARNYFAGPACWRCRTIGNQRKHPISVCWEIDSRYWFRQSGCAGLLRRFRWWRRNPNCCEWIEIRAQLFFSPPADPAPVEIAVQVGMRSQLIVGCNPEVMWFIRVGTIGLLPHMKIKDLLGSQVYVLTGHGGFVKVDSS